MDARTAFVRVRTRRQVKDAYQVYVNLHGTTINQDWEAYMMRRAVQPLMAAAEGPGRCRGVAMCAMCCD